MNEKIGGLYMKKMPKERKLFTKHYNTKRMYDYLSDKIGDEIEQNSPSTQQDIASFENRMQSDKQTYSTKAGKQSKFAKWGAIIGFAGSIGLMSLAFFIFNWATAILPGTFLIRTGILLGASLLGFGALPAWLAHRSRKMVKLTEKYEEKLHKAQQQKEQTLARANVQKETKNNVLSNQETLKDILTFTPEIKALENKEQPNEEYGVASADVLTNAPAPEIIEVEPIERTVELNPDEDLGIYKSTYVDSQDSSFSFDDDDSSDDSSDDGSNNNSGSDDNSSSSNSESEQVSQESTIEENADSTESSESEQTISTSVDNQNADKDAPSAPAPSKVGRYKFEIISTRANKKGKGKITTKVVSFSANSQEAFLEKMRKFSSNRSQVKKRLDTEAEQASWLSEGKYPTTLQFKVTDIFHPTRQFVSQEYNNGFVSEEGKKQDIETFIKVIDSLRKTWSQKLQIEKQQIQEQKETEKVAEARQTEQKVQDELSDDIAKDIDNQEENKLAGTKDELPDEIVDTIDCYEENRLNGTSNDLPDEIVDILDENDGLTLE